MKDVKNNTPGGQQKTIEVSNETEKVVKAEQSRFYVNFVSGVYE